MKKLVAVAALATASMGAFAADGPVTMDVAPVVSSINGIGPNLALVGGAVLAISAAMFGYRAVKSFLGR
ncbi:major capsid protein [Burkholderia oklahomensis]|uniref:Membrane protein n=1 Tax=Burkholderia oklahomensis TaxID=342113 RepID=A0AAI8B4R6_9BURK|nr:major capsid protein [Burkholderia oklahomensis]AIO65681.1 putative membrane protein [Burkholderia oklahomensis]AJX33326.1 putative membrane protein [Burkholderia oklahomensis C6786]AOI40861.1 coat protein [Burkholderia oklahomensis EO147]AOI44464.1 coat protein [Burkholderia oklahomensis C6786]KUY55423.1 coat protein [Burkholderia oklahomensis EO147]